VSNILHGQVLDLNLLLHAVNRDSAHHDEARVWLERTLSGDEPVALPWVVLLGFLRISTSARILPDPLLSEQALEVIDGWLAQPSVLTLSPGPEHWRILRNLIEETGTAGNLTTDTHLAALAIENGAELCSTDSDFARFARLRWLKPLA
jgi:toxin-antitoxin system PIN domain toxin